MMPETDAIDVDFLKKVHHVLLEVCFYIILFVTNAFMSIPSLNSTDPC